MASVRCPFAGLKGLNDNRARKIGAQHGEEEEFALGIHVRPLGEIIAQVALGQKIREEGRNTAADGLEVGHQSAGAALEREAQSGAPRIVDIVLLESEYLPVAGES